MKDNGTQDTKALPSLQARNHAHGEDHSHAHGTGGDRSLATQAHRADLRSGGVSVRPVCGKYPGAPTLGILERWFTMQHAYETGAYL